jgi:hypothetical protein
MDGVHDPYFIDRYLAECDSLGLEPLPLQQVERVLALPLRQLAHLVALLQAAESDSPVAVGAWGGRIVGRELAGRRRRQFH